MNFSVCYGVWIQVANAFHDEIVERRDPWPSRSKNARFRASERALHLEPWILDCIFLFVVKNSTNVHQDVKILNLKVGQTFIFRPRHANLNCLRRDACPSIANAETVEGNRLQSTSSSLLTKHWKDWSYSQKEWQKVWRLKKDEGLNNNIFLTERTSGKCTVQLSHTTRSLVDSRITKLNQNCFQKQSPHHSINSKPLIHQQGPAPTACPAPLPSSKVLERPYPST